MHPGGRIHGHLQHLPDNACMSQRRGRIGLAADRRKPSRSGGGSAGGDVFLVLLTWDAEVDVQVDQARRDDFAGAVNHFDVRAGVQIGRDLAHEAVLDKQVGCGVEILGGVDHPPVFQQYVSDSCFSR